MQTLTIEVTDNSAIQLLHELEERHLIKIVGDDKTDSPALPGEEMTIPEFKSWIEKAERSPSITLEQAKQQWASKKKKLQQAAD